MNIVYLAELNPLVCSGGGETILGGIIRESGEHNVSVYTPSDNGVVGAIDRADVCILADLDNEPNKNPRTWFGFEVFDKIISDKKYVTFATGYCDVCRKDYTPCSLTGKFNCFDCPRNDQTRRYLWENSKKNCFLSKLQAEKSLNHLQIKGSPYICTPDLDLDSFYDFGIERDIDLLFVGVICEAKGYFEVCKYIDDNNLYSKNIVWVGPSLVGVPKFGSWLQKIPREDMPGLMNRAKVTIGFPRWYEGFGLWAIEAAMCGCEIITNKNLGALSNVGYNMEALKDKTNYQGNYKAFWDMIGDL